jgi:hypothetical protein
MSTILQTKDEHQMNGLENKRTSAVLFLSLLAAEGFPILGLSNSMADLTAHIVLDNAT